MTSPVDAIGPPATLPANYDPTRADVDATDGADASSALKLDSQSFLQLLVAQLKYQDPTNPVDTSKFMQQTAMLSQVQAINSMKSEISDLVATQQTQSATGMVGKAISFVDPSGDQASGIVDAMVMHGGSPMLEVDGYAVPLAGVIEVANPVAAPSNPDTGPVNPDPPVDGTDPTGTGHSPGNDDVPVTDPTGTGHSPGNDDAPVTDPDPDTNDPDAGTTTGDSPAPTV